MSTLIPSSPAPARARDVSGAPSRIRLAVIGAALVLGTLAAVPFVDSFAPSLPFAVVGGIGLLLLTALAVGRYEAAAALGFLLSGVVKIEPAPSDAIFAVIIAVAIATGRFKLARVPEAVVVLLGGLILLNVLSTTSALDLPSAIRFGAITLYLFVFGAWVSVFADRPRRGRLIVKAWLWIAVFSAIVGAASLQFPGFPFREFLVADGLSRGSALFKDPNVYGPFLVPITLILIAELVRPHLLRIRLGFGLALAAVLATGILYSFSRAAWGNFLLSLAIMLTVMLLRRRVGGRLIGVVGGMAIVGMAVLAVIVVSGQGDFVGQRAQLQGYDTERFGAQRAGVGLAEQYPLGVGPGQFIQHHPVETHSTYVRVLAEQGALALALWLALCLLTLGFAVANAMAARRAGGIDPAPLLGAWCGLMFNGIVVDTLHWRHLWLVAGLIWAAWFARKLADRAPAEVDESPAGRRPAPLTSLPSS